MENYYINRGINVFNQLPANIKQIYNTNKFNLMINKYIYTCDRLTIVLLL